MKAVAFALILVSACGSSPPPIDSTAHLAKENEITALWTQIRTFRRDMQMNLDPSPQDVFQLKLRSVVEAKRMCPATHKVPQTCNEVCNLADDICDNAEAICKIATELGKDDDYAQEKCSGCEGVVQRGQAEVLQLQQQTGGRMKGLVGLALGACCGIVIACAADRKQTMAPASSSVAPQSPEDDQIRQLAAEIDRQRTTMGLPEQHGAAAAMPMATAGSDGTCHPVETDICKQTCTLSDSICSNAKKICSIAAQLPNDSWATQKCSDASATCDAARRRCCECQ